MCRYELSVNMRYGVFNMNLSDDYKTAINTYNKVKSEYEGIPCDSYSIFTPHNKHIFSPVSNRLNTELRLLHFLHLLSIFPPIFY